MTTADTLASPPPRTHRDRLASAYVAAVVAMATRRPALPLDHTAPPAGRNAINPPPMGGAL